jgi:hypothetical protein
MRTLPLAFKTGSDDALRRELRTGSMRGTGHRLGGDGRKAGVSWQSFL